jgi:radical SAM protein with 4Fe4S-binding SPASM domain
MMCVQGIPELRKKFGYIEKLKTEQIKKILEEGQRYNCPSISFHGDNEPFLAPEMTDWFKMARDHGFIDIMVNTNGSTIDRELARKIVESGVTRLRFSLDAISKETFEIVRRSKELPQIMKNIEMFIEVRDEMNSPLPKVGVNFIKMAANIHELEPFIEYWNPKVDYIVIQDYMTHDVKGDYGHLDIDNRNPLADFKCVFPWQRVFIRGDGDVLPCCTAFSTYMKIGNIYEDSIYNIWQSKKARDLRKLQAEGRYMENEYCLECSRSGT